MMMGPGLCSLLLSLCLALDSLQSAKSKPLSAMPDSASPPRLRRDVLPYEAEMFAYPPTEGSRNEAFYPGLATEAGLARLGLGPRELERLGLALGRAERPQEALGQALQQLAEESRRRDQEAAYLGRLLRAWKDMGLTEAYQADPGLRAGYPDYEELAPAGRKLPGDQGAFYAPGYAGGGRGEAEEAAGMEVEDEVVHYLLGRILANMEATGDYPRPPRLVKRDLGSQAKYLPGPRRARRSPELTEAQPNLLRIKRLGGLEETQVEEEEEGENYQAQGLREGPVERQRPKAGGGGRSRRYQRPERGTAFLPD